MARVSSQKVRQALLDVGDPLDVDLLPEKLQLFKADGTPIDLIDSTSMHWAGEWDAGAPYSKSNVVSDQGVLYILLPDSIPAGQLSPSVESSPLPPTVATPGDAAGASDLAYALDDGDGVSIGTGEVGAMFFFDLAVSGDVSIDESDHPTHYIKLYDSTGMEANVIAANTGVWGTPVVATDLPPGRYFVWVQEAIDSTPPPDFHLSVTLSNGAEFPVPAPPNWAFLLTGVEDLEGWYMVNTGAPAVDFQNSWQSIDDWEAQYRKRPDGTVELRGRIDPNTYADAAFTLPVGYRPSREVEFVTPSFGSAVWVLGVVAVTPDGDVIPRVGGADWISIVCSFSVD